jgi:hypothetical protein
MENKKILDAWIEFLREEDIENAKIDFNEIHSHQFFNISEPEILVNDEPKGISIKIPEQTLAILKKNYPLAEEQATSKEQGLFLMFPLIKSKEKEEDKKQETEFIYPLFLLEITSLQKQIYSNPQYTIDIPIHEGSTLTPLINVFATFLGVDEEEFAENLSFSEQVHRITGKKVDNFQNILKELREFIQANLADSNKTAQLLDHEAAIASIKLHDNLSLMQELKKMKDIDIPSSSPLLNKYMQGVSTYDETRKSPSPAKIWYGSFGKYPLGCGQATILQKLQDSTELLSVQGPPGTGKTTLFLSVIANQIVRRALTNIQGKDENNLMVIVSTTNKAVDNVSERFSADEEYKGMNWLYFIGGSKEKISQQSMTRLENLIDELRTKEYSPEKQSETKAKLLHIVAEFEKERSAYQDLIDKKQQLRLQSLKSSNDDEAKNKFSTVQTSIKELLASLGQVGMNSIGENNLQEQVNQGLEIIKHQLYCFENEILHIKKAQTTLKQIESLRPTELIKDDSVLAWLSGDAAKDLMQRELPSWLGYMFSSNKRKMVKGFIRAHEEELMILQHVPLKLPHLRTLSTFTKRVYALEGWSCLVKYCPHLHINYQQNLSLLNSRLKEQENNVNSLGSKQNQLKSYLHFLVGYQQLQELNAKLDRYPDESFFEYFRINKVLENKALYDLAREYNYQEMLRRKRELIPALEDWKTFLMGYDKDVFKRWVNNVESFATLVSLAYPVITSTLLSIRNLFKFDIKHFHQYKPFYLCLSDESGMIPLHRFPPALFRSKRAVVVGDPKQLEPIVTVAPIAVERLKEKHFGKDDEAFLRYNPASVSAYHRASLCKTGDYRDIGDGILLDEHRRCQPQIAQLFVDIAEYQGMSIKTEPIDSNTRTGKSFQQMGCHPLMFYGAEGQLGQRKNTNIEEVETIELILKKLHEVGFILNKDIGIITPYRNQAQLLKERFAKMLNHVPKKEEKIGTVHSFQGAEFEVILFSPVICNPKHSSAFLNRKPNFMNVAVSRAKLMFITVGNFHKLQLSGGYLKMLCDSVSTDSLILMENNGDQGIQLQKKLDKKESNLFPLYSCEHINYFAKIFEKAQKEIILITPWIRQTDKAKDHPQLQVIKKALQRGVRVILYYGYDRKGTMKDETDDGTPELIQEYKDLLKENMIRLSQGTHEKIIICDQQEAAVGSWNWLSHNYHWLCRKQQSNLMVRRETSVIVQDQKIIQSLLEGIVVRRS